MVCLTTDKPRYDCFPLAIAHTVALEDLVHRRPPRHAAEEEARIRAVVDAVVRKLEAGEGVVIQCAVVPEGPEPSSAAY